MKLNIISSYLNIISTSSSSSRTILYSTLLYSREYTHIKHRSLSSFKQLVFLTILLLGIVEIVELCLRSVPESVCLQVIHPLPHPTSPHLISPHLTSSHLTSNSTTTAFTKYWNQLPTILWQNNQNITNRKRRKNPQLKKKTHCMMKQYLLW